MIAKLGFSCIAIDKPAIRTDGKSQFRFFMNVD